MKHWLVAALLFAACVEEQPISPPMLMPDPSPFEYPVALWDMQITGETVLLVRVTRDGLVDSVTISNSSGRAEFDSAAVTGARKLRFVPGKKGDRPMGMWTKVPVRFSLDSTGAGAQ